MTLHWHRWIITHGQAPSAQHCLSLHPLTLWDHSQGATSILPLSLCHPASLSRLWAGSLGVWGVVWLGGHGHLPFLASIRLLNSCPVSLKCFWLGLLSAFHFLWFVWIRAVRVIKKNPTSSGQKPQEGMNFKPKPTSMNLSY